MTAALLRQDNTVLPSTLLQSRSVMGKVSASEIPKDLPESFAPEFCVRNTFIDSATSRRPSLEDFLPRSRCFSAPSPVIGLRMRQVSTIDPVFEEETLGWSGSDASASSSNTQLPRPFPCVPWSSIPTFGSVHGHDSMNQNGLLQMMVSQVHTHSSGMTLMPPTATFTAEAAGHAPFTARQIVGLRPMSNAQLVDSGDARIAAASEQLPSEGSIGHASGVCKPCAWYHSANGCKTGTSCKFCHACAPGELKRRKKEKNMLLAAQNANAKA